MVFAGAVKALERTVLRLKERMEPDAPRENPDAGIAFVRAAVAEGVGSVLGVLPGGGICVRGVCKRVCHAVRLRGTAACV